MLTLGLAVLKSDECHRTFIPITEDVCDSEAESSNRQEVSGAPAQHAAPINLQSEQFHHSRRTVVAQNSIFVATSVSLSCRHPLSEVVRVVGGVSYCLLWLPAVLYRQAELRLHLLLQHAALQRAQKKASHLIRSSNIQLAANDTDAPPPGVLRDAPPPRGLNGINHQAVAPD